MRGILIALITTALAGCATHLVPLDEVKAVPADRILATTHTVPAEGSQKVTVIRNSGAFGGSGVKYPLLVDGEPVTGLWSGEAVTIYLPKGEHLLTIKFPDFPFSNPPITTLVNVPSKFSIYRIDTNDAGITLQPSFE